MFAELSSDVYHSWERKDILHLVSLHSKYPHLRVSIQDVFAQLSDDDYKNLTYEDLNAIMRNSTGNPIMEQFFGPMLADREYQILTELCDMSINDLKSYIETYPQRKKFIYDVLGASIVAQKHNLSVQELLYLQYKFPTLESIVIQQEIGTRGTEIQKIIRNNIDSYITQEQKQTELFYYVLERKTYAYICNKYEQVCYQYACIAEVPNTTEEIESQFRNIFSQCLKSNELREYLQLEADAYCEHINAARKAYCISAGISKFTPLQITVPDIPFTFFSDQEIISKIPQAREDYIDNRQTVNKASKVARFFMGGLTTMVAKGVADYLVGSNLSSKIINARLKYVDEAFVSLQRRVIDNTVVVKENIGEQIHSNEVQFKKVIKGKR